MLTAIKVFYGLQRNAVEQAAWYLIDNKDLVTCAIKEVKALGKAVGEEQKALEVTTQKQTKRLLKAYKDVL